MSTRGFRIVPLTTSVIMTLATGCGADAPPAAGPPEPEEADITAIQAQILNLMKDLQASHGLAYVFISHDL